MRTSTTNARPCKSQCRTISDSLLVLLYGAVINLVCCNTSAGGGVDTDGPLDFGSVQLLDIVATRRLYVDPVTAPPAESTSFNELRFDDPYTLDNSVMFEQNTFSLELPRSMQSLLSQTIKYDFGLVAARSVYSQNRKRNYLNRAFTLNSALPLPEKGLGAYGSLQASPRLAFTAGIHEDVLHRWASDPADTGAWISALGIDYRPEAYHPGDAHYRLTLWRRNSGAQFSDSSGVALNIEQHYASMLSWSPFVQFSYRLTDSLEVNQQTAAGVNIGHLPWDKGARLGLAYAHKLNSAQDQADHTVEMYYRMLATPWLEITPDVQWLSRTAAQGQAEPLTISRVTIRLLF